MKDSKVYIIAEVAQAHDGSLGILHSYIDAVADTGADAIKFQMHIADAESSPFEPFRVAFSYQDHTRYDYWKRMEFTQEQWVGIKKHCEEVGLEFLVSPFSVAAVRMLESLGVKRYKIGSGEVRNYLMLEHIALTGKDILISTGMSGFTEIEQALAFLDECKASQERVIFQCTTAYPTPPEQIGLNVLPELQNRFNLPIGLSDHSGTIFAPLAAVTLGAKYLECHVVFDKRMFGPDSPASLTFAEFKQMVEGVRFLERAHANPVNKEDIQGFEVLKRMFGKSLAVSRTLKMGETLVLNDLESKKPADRGIPAELFRQVINKRLKHSIDAGDFLQWGDLSE
ncbi:N-acetylneuraminate synthase family protein [Methylomonas methanica]|uniref:N-acetylneuraminate synthase n=1 Tax=Methylomonas methanica (strain DSM 25384 / MC09) TaxID=857087 RepID=F9ZWB9_METMM|nr:N-acetylneuraminate synthase family protein [Methylomonas methanica]AEF99588.1 N-acetylneuraminate synthase [Methylomonas methanica MC09]